MIVPSARQVLSFKVAPVLGAAISVENIEVMDFEAIVHLTGQLHQQVRDMPPGARITGFPIAPRRRNSGRARVRRPLTLVSGGGRRRPGCADVWFCARYGAD